MQNGEKIENFFRRVVELRTALQALGEEVTDDSLVPIVLRALPPSFRVFVTCLNVPHKTPSFEELVNLLQQEEAIFGETNTQNNQALAAKQKGKQPDCRSGPLGQSNQNQDNSSKKKTKCLICGKKGHKLKEC